VSNDRSLLDATPEAIAALERDFAAVHRVLREFLQVLSGKLFTDGPLLPGEQDAADIGMDAVTAAHVASPAYRDALYRDPYLTDVRISAQTRELLNLIDDLNELHIEPVGAHLDVDDFLKRLNAIAPLA